MQTQPHMIDLENMIDILGACDGYEQTIEGEFAIWGANHPDHGALTCVQGSMSDVLIFAENWKE
jgi:hypothetical protein